jgi:hypothetical protein
MNNPILSRYPSFRLALETHLPGTLPMEEYLLRTRERLADHGFVDANTLGMVAVCRDEIASDFVAEVIRHWGKTFGCRSLGGFVLLGRSGIETGVSHAPVEDGRRRFVFYAMPHIAISERGEVGVVYREGLHEESHACGSIAAVLRELESGRIDLRTDFDDIEQCCVRQKILSALNYGDKPDLLAATQLACRIIHEDGERLLGGIDPALYDYAFLTGILVHGPEDSDWVCPASCRLVGGGIPGGGLAIEGGGAGGVPALGATALDRD